MVYVVGQVACDVVAGEVHLRQLPVRPGASCLGRPLVPPEGHGDVLDQLLAGLVEVGHRETGVRVAEVGIVAECVLHLDLSVLILLSRASASRSPCLAAWFRNFLARGMFFVTYLPS